MITQAQLAEAFGRNVKILKRQTDGLTDEDSLRQPPYGGNCLNWLVGHLANNRDIILTLLGAEPVLGAAGQRYKRESEPVIGAAEGLLPLADLVAAIERSQPAIAGALQAATPEVLNREIMFAGRPGPLADRLFFLYFHETYHLGQAEPLRNLAGRHEKVI